jgi:SAM-dependent methyltransferase
MFVRMVMKPSFPDHFSKHADAYAAHRPTYPKELFRTFAGLANAHHAVWDVGCGNGQASLGLADHFEQVFATDASRDQIARAVPCERVQYACVPAEAPELEDQSIDAVFVAQALHWFQFDAFYAAVRRVCRPGAPIVAVLYELSTIAPEIDVVMRAFYRGAIGPYWPGERAHIDTCYRSIPWPFAPLEFPVHAMRKQWTLTEMMHYVGTWSAVRRYVEAGHADPVPALAESLRPLWEAGGPDGSGEVAADAARSEVRRYVSWPLHRLSGRV